MPEDKTDEELLALIEAEGAAQEASATPPEAVQPAPSNAAPLFSLFKKLTGADILCVFGDSGSGKSKLVSELAFEEARNGRRVLFWDTEQGFSDGVVQKMKDAGIDYRRTSVLRDIYQSIRSWNANLVIIDSSTLSVTGKWFSEQLDSRGRLLQELQFLYYTLKDWCHKAPDRMVAVVCQPVSVFGGRGLEILGDKSNFFLKEAFYVDFEVENFVVKKRVLRVFKSRTLPDGITVCALTTTSTGMTFGELNPEAVRLVE